MKLVILLLLVSCSTPIEKITVSKKVEISEKFFSEPKETPPVVVKKKEAPKPKGDETKNNKENDSERKITKKLLKKVHWSEVLKTHVSMKLTLAVDYSKISVGDMILEVLPRSKKDNVRKFQADLKLMNSINFFMTLKIR